MQESFSRELGQPVVIENRGGGGGLNATDAYFKSDHDAHTLLLGGIAPLTIIPNIRSVSYVPERDFVPIGTVWRSAQTLVVRPGSGRENSCRVPGPCQGQSRQGDDRFGRPCHCVRIWLPSCSSAKRAST